MGRLHQWSQKRLVDGYSSVSRVRCSQQKILVGCRGFARFHFDLPGAPGRSEGEDLFRDRTGKRTARSFRFEWSETLGPRNHVAEQYRDTSARSRLDDSRMGT